MASIDKRNGKWRARWRTPDGRSRSRTFTRKVDAERHLTQMEHQKLTGGYVDPSAGRVTFERYAEDWREAQVHRPSTAAHVETNLRRHVYPVLGARPLGSIRPSEVQALVKGLEVKGLAASTIETIYRYVVAVFRAAVADRLIVVAPTTGVRLPKVEPKRVKPLELEQVQALAEAVPARYRALVMFAAGSGLRQGECFGLTVDRVDFLRRRITVDRQIDPVGSGELAPLKTEASYRGVPLPQSVADELAAHLATFGIGDGGLIFTDDAGRPLRRQRFSEIWRSARGRAGLDEAVTFHDLRHFYASLLIRHGESVKVVQSRLGHASAAETLDTYSHLWPDSEDRTREAVDSVLGAHSSAMEQRHGTI